MTNEKKLFIEIFKKLEKNYLKYIILRGGDFFYSNSEEGELDILIKKSDLPKTRSIFRKIPHSRELKNNIDLTHPFLVRVKKERYLLDFDFQIRGVGYCGSPVLKEEFLFQNIIKKNGLTYLNYEAEFLMLLVHGFIFKKKFDYFKKYMERFLELYEKSEKRKVQRELKEMFGKNLSNKIINCIEERNLEKLFDLRKKLIKIHLTKNPIEIFPVIISKWMRFRNYFHLDRFFYFINPFKWAPLIAFIGSDGSGKSALVDKTKEYLKLFKIPCKKVSGGVFSSTKNPFKKKNKNETYSKRVLSSFKKKNALELIARIFLQIPKQIKILYYRKKGILVISDRYSYDLINFYGARGILKYLILKLFQKPKRCFYVKVRPDILKKRNNDLEINAIKKVVSTIEENKRTLSLIEINNGNFQESEKELKDNLVEIIKNV